MKTNFTLIVGDAHTEPGVIEFFSIDFIRSYTTQDEAEDAGEQSLQDGFDTYVIPELYRGTIQFKGAGK